MSILARYCQLLVTAQIFNLRKMKKPTKKKTITMCNKCDTNTIHRIENDGTQHCVRCEKYQIKALLINMKI